MKNIQTNFLKYIIEKSSHIEPIGNYGYKVYNKADKSECNIFKTKEEALKVKKEIEKQRGLDLGIIDLEADFQRNTNKSLKENGAKFDIQTKWKYTGTKFIGDTFTASDGNNYQIFFIDNKKYLEVKVFYKTSIVGFSEFEYDASGNLRNSMYVTVYPSYRKIGIAKAIDRKSVV